MKNTLLLLLALTLVGILGAMAVIYGGSRASGTGDNQPETKHQVVSMKTPCAPDEITELHVIQAVQRSDEAALDGLVAREGVMMLEEGTDVNRILSRDSFDDVGVNSGYYVGKTCWLPSAVLR